MTDFDVDLAPQVPPVTPCEECGRLKAHPLVWAAVMLNPGVDGHIVFTFAGFCPGDCEEFPPAGGKRMRAKSRGERH